MAVLGVIMAVPALISFYVLWVISMLLRPVFVISVGLLLWNFPSTVLKFKQVVNTAAYMFLTNDKKYKKLPDPNMDDFKVKHERKTIIFVRHGESCWNDTFNAGERSKLDFLKGFLPGLLLASLTEIYLALTGRVDSWFYDSPLSEYGVSQITRLAEFLKRPPTTPEEKKYIDILNGTSSTSSVLISSNLRRAISTICIGFRSRLTSSPSSKIIIHPSLQEISRNPDTLSITPPQTLVEPSWIEKRLYPNVVHSLQNQCDMTFHTGNKPLTSNGGLRMSEFCDFAFTLNEDVLICGGHSLWFRSYFRQYLPSSSKHVAKVKKMVNGGCVKFEVLRAVKGGKGVYVIDEESIRVVYGGF
ncbi:hypothetical protein TrST_g11764 [Triparma strigata]|uniref:Uncharacterized protein n=1 Tax=Triparma strigata TaxID=1606541 RepID=A0A9W7B463_9STRA|nr:hypothetical protein TrST_g11764 [Triparma strigata]